MLGQTRKQPDPEPNRPNHKLIFNQLTEGVLSFDEELTAWLAHFDHIMIKTNGNVRVLRKCRCTHTHSLTPAVNTAELPLSNISSSSSSVVAFPAVRERTGFICVHDKEYSWPSRALWISICVTHWSLTVFECVLYFSPWSPPGLHYTLSLLPQTSWTELHAGRQEHS